MLLIKNAIIIDSGSKLNGKKRDILIREGLIQSIKVNIDQAKAKVWDLSGACVSIGWMDIGTEVCDPGFEHREDLLSVSNAAAKGGYTAIACLPNTSPTVHSKSEVNYILNNTAGGLVDFLPIGAISKNCEGKDITEIYDMHHAGAVAFSDGKHTIQHSGVMMRALQYVKAFDGLIINHPSDETIAGSGQMHEGMVSTSLGMKGIAAISEELMVQRDLYLAEYADSRLHLLNVSSGRSIELIKLAQSKGQSVTASVPALNLIFDDEALSSFDANYKVLPPLRSKQDIKVLRKALKSGILDVITSNHTPLDKESKELEFPYADFGIIGLETTFALLNTHLIDSTFNLEALISILANNPRKLLRTEVPKIEEGTSANLTVFDPDVVWTFDLKDIQSKSKNTPFVGTEFRGKVLGIVNNGNFRRF